MKHCITLSSPVGDVVDYFKHIYKTGEVSVLSDGSVQFLIPYDDEALLGHLDMSIMQMLRHGMEMPEGSIKNAFGT